MKRAALWLALVPSILLGGVVEWPASVMMVNAHILTMDASDSVADALLMEGQYIVAIGSRELVQRQAHKSTRIIDMKGRTLMPGFVDAHSHFPSSALAHTGLDLAPPPVGDVGSVSQLLKRIETSADLQQNDEWVVGFNYDDASLQEERHPTRAELDTAAPDHPVYLWHRSGHMGVANSRALEELGYRDSDNAPILAEGAQVGRTDTGELNGLLQEHAAPDLARLLRELPKKRLLSVFSRAGDEYLQAGITTVQNGYADILSMHLLKWAQRVGLFHQRVLVWPAHNKLSERLVLDFMSQEPPDTSKALADSLDWSMQDRHEYAVSAIKLIVDGSPQGRTAWLTEPYLYNGMRAEKYRGYPSIPVEELERLVSLYHRAGFQLALHGNGDAAIDAIIKALVGAQAEYPRQDTRHFVVHAQTIRRDQLALLAKLHVGVSFFPAHTFYWGDWYSTRVFGKARAQQISPLAIADELGVRYSIHSDAPVTPVSPMQMLWSAVNRRTLSDVQLGAELVVSRIRALRAMTIDPAWQNHLDNDRGSLEVGKLADVISLSDNPLEADDVREISVVWVWIGGRERYRHSGFQ